MPSKKLLISAALTAFILVVATGIASAYKRVSSSIEAVKVEEAGRTDSLDQAQPTAMGDVASSAQSQQVLISHQEAALVATNYLGQTDLYSVENIVWEGTDAYEVVFSSGDMVYISMTGEVLGAEVPEPVNEVIEVVPSPLPTPTATAITNSTSSGNTSTARSSSSNNDDHNDDHDDDDDDHEEEHEDESDDD